MKHMTKDEQEQRIGTEVVQSHALLKWLITIAGANLGVFIVGGITIWVNDSTQDDKLLKHDVQIAQKQSISEAKLTRELLEAKIQTNSKSADEIKQILFRMEDSITQMRQMDNELHHKLNN